MEKTPNTAQLAQGTLSLFSPAKVNHFLHIVGRREDGYHLLQTLFQFLDYGDLLHFELRDDDQITLFSPDMVTVPTQTNLVYRAAYALQQAAQVKQGVHIQLDKKIPLGAGLGGGSSNAATTLLALNYLWQLNWSLPQLLALGVSLGADIPIFIYGHAAWGEGIGEQLTPIELSEPWVFVVTPPCHVATPKMFCDPDLTRNTPSFKIGTLAKDEISSLLGKLKNDFEPLVRRHYPEVNDAMKWLSNYGKAQLSGSGASVFACFTSQEEAQEAAQHLPPRFKGFVAKALNHSPLRQSAEKWDFKFDSWGVAKW